MSLIILYWKNEVKGSKVKVNVIIQILGIIGIGASIVSFQSNNHKTILAFRTLNEFFFGIQYILLGAYTGAAMNFFGCIRNVLFSRLVEKGRSTITPRIVFCGIFTAAGMLTWGGAKSILIIFAKGVSTLAYGSSHTRYMRILIFTTSACWLAYNLCVKSYTGALCEALTLGSIISGFIRFDIYPRMKCFAAVKKNK